MAWSEAARQASIEARRATAEARKGSSIKEKGKEEAHRKAAEAHRAAARAYPPAATEQIGHHEKMAAMHEARAERAAFHQGGGAEAISKTESGLSNKQTAKNASDHAEAMTAQARKSGSKQDHEDAMEAHSHAAKMQRAAGNTKAAKAHEFQAEVHNELRRTDKVVESADRIVAATSAMNAANSPTALRAREAERLNPSQRAAHERGKRDFEESAKPVVLGPKAQARIQSERAKAASEKAKASGKAEDHDRAADEHRSAAVMHGNADRGQSELARTGQGRLPEPSLAGGHHEKMADKHEHEAYKIREREAAIQAGHEAASPPTRSHAETASREMSETKRASKEANDASKKARASGSERDHADAADAHRWAALKNRAAGGTGHDRAAHHDEMVKMHLAKIDKIHEAESDERARNAPKGVGKYWNS